MFHMWDPSLGMSWWWLFGGLWMLLFWGGLIALIIWGITKLTGKGNTITNHNPLDVAKARYARGEIKREEFEQLKTDLK